MKIFWILTLAVCSAANQNENEAETRVLWGEEAEAHKYPFNVYVSCVNSKGERHGCGGVLLATNVVGTAGHCAMAIKKCTLVFGTHKLGVVEQSRADIDVTPDDVVFHPKFDPRGRFGKNDIALFAMKKHVRLSRQISLPKLDPSKLPPGTPVTIIGYGNVRTGSSNPLYETHSNIISKAEFLRLMSELLNDEKYLDERRKQLRSEYSEIDHMNNAQLKAFLLKEYDKAVDDKKTWVVYNGQSNFEPGDSGGALINTEDDSVIGIGSQSCGICQKTGESGFAFYVKIRDIYNWLKEKLKQLHPGGK